jgi:hypothetical protein
VPLFPPQYFGGIAKKPNDGILSICFEGYLLLPEGRRRAYFKTDPSAYAMLNEEIGYMLAKSANLPQPNAGRIWIQGAVLHEFDPKRWPDSTKPGLCWVTYEAKDRSGKPAPSIKAKLNISSSTPITPELTKLITGIFSKLKLLARLIDFDAWVANIDRNIGNILLTSPDSFVLIDHGAILGGPLWPAALHSNPDAYAKNMILDHIYSPAKDTLSLPIKNAIVKECDALVRAYDDSSAWLNQILAPAKGPAFFAAHQFLRQRAASTVNHMREQTGLVA